MPKLIVNPGTPQAQEFELKPGKNLLGRGFANDLKLEDASVSSSHAMLEVNGNVVTVTDLGSTNGTRVNGLPATGNPLQSGQMLKLGAVELLYMADVAASATGIAPTPPPPAAVKIATEFVIRDPSRVGVAPPAPAPTGGELRIPGVATAPPPVPVQPAAELRIPIAPPSAPPPPPTPIVAAPALPQPAPIMATLVAEAPLPAGGGMRFSNLVPAPPPAPVAAPPAAPAVQPAPQPAPPIPAGVMELPQGKTACRFHRNSPGQWLCPKCKELFCLLCVEAKPTPSGVGAFCRACGTQCVAVKPKATPKGEKKPEFNLSTEVLLRTIGFGLGGAIVGAGVWTGVAAFTGFDQPAVFAPVIGVACGYGVKIASQDRPGIFFSIIAAIATLLGATIGKIAALMVTHHGFVFAAGPLGLAVFGLALGMFLAWKLGGGDF